MSANENQRHIPVLFSEVEDLLHLQPDSTVLDVTLGLAGHANMFVSYLRESGHFIGIDADAENLQQAKEHLQQASCKTTFHHSNFLELPHLDIPKCDVIFADLGLSSPHLDDAEKGFSFQEDAPLDMRYNRAEGFTAAEWIEKSSERQLLEMLRDYGEVQSPHKVARLIKEQLPSTTHALTSSIDAALGYRGKNEYAKVFQALRIAVNTELDALKTLLDYLPTLLKPKGRVLIISYHSLEDRLVKQAFKALCTPEIDDLTGAISVPADFQPLTKKPITPSQDEINQNSRSRSAKLRAIERTDSV